MRKLSKQTRIQADSERSIAKAIVIVTEDLADTLQFEGRKLRPGPLLNALAVWFVELPEAERLRIGTEALRRLEQYLCEDPHPIAGETHPITPKVIHGHSVDPQGKGRMETKRRKKQSG